MSLNVERARSRANDHLSSNGEETKLNRLQVPKHKTSNSAFNQSVHILSPITNEMMQSRSITAMSDKAVSPNTRASSIGNNDEEKLSQIDTYETNATQNLHESSNVDLDHQPSHNRHSTLTNSVQLQMLKAPTEGHENENEYASTNNQLHDNDDDDDIKDVDMDSTDCYHATNHHTKQEEHGPASLPSLPLQSCNISIVSLPDSRRHSESASSEHSSDTTDTSDTSTSSESTSYDSSQSTSNSSQTTQTTQTTRT